MTATGKNRRYGAGSTLNGAKREILVGVGAEIAVARLYSSLRYRSGNKKLPVGSWYKSQK